MLRRHKLGFNAASRSFLSEFGSLVLDVPLVQLRHCKKVRFDPLGAADDFQFLLEELDYLEKVFTLARGPVSVIGTEGGLVLLLMASDGRVFSIDIDASYWTRIASDPDAAIEALCQPYANSDGHDLPRDFLH